MSNETRRILLVEDEKAIRDAVTAYLERENYWVTAVGDGQEALEEFSKHHFDLVVLDLMLPRVPGERVCRAIRDNSDVPIIMLTAKGEVEDRIIGLELGADDYVVKPFKPRADLLLDTTHTYEVCLWHALLDTMPPDEDLTATQRRQLDTLRARFAAFPPLDTALVPADSMLREFIGA